MSAGSEDETWLRSTQLFAFRQPKNEVERLQDAIAKRLFGAVRQPRVQGRYDVLSTLGRGGLGVVHLALDRELDRQVAIKVLQMGFARDAKTTRDYAIREAHVLARLDHPHVVKIFAIELAHELGADLAEDDAEGGLALVMEYVRGRTLRKYLGEQPSRASLLRIFGEAASALQAAHDVGVVHRDFKPENVMVDERERARVLDFGLAKVFEPVTEPTGEVTEEAASMVMGTLSYMPPEQLRGESTDARADQFSFALALFEALSGERPFGAVQRDAQDAGLVCVRRLDRLERGPIARPRTLSARMYRVLTRALDSNPARRWPSIAALWSAVERAGRPRRAVGLVAGTTMVGALGGFLAMGLPTPDPCAAEPDACVEQVVDARPDPRDDAPQLEERLDRVTTTWGAGHRTEAWALLEALARDVADEPAWTRAQVALVFGDLHLESGNVDEAVKSADRAYKLAANDDAETSLAAATLMVVASAESGRVDRSDRWLGFARASLQRGPASWAARSNFVNATRYLYGVHGRGAEANVMRLAFFLLMQSEEASPLNRVRGLLALADAARTVGDVHQAEGLARQAMQMAEEYVGPEHPELAVDRLTWAELLEATGDYAGCVEQSERAAVSIDDGSDATVARATGQLAVCLDRLGRGHEAREAHERAVAMFETIAARGGITDLGTALLNYADTVRRQGDLEQARGLFSRANDVSIADHGHDDATALAGLAHTQQGLAETKASRRTALRAREAVRTEPHPDDVLALLLLVDVARNDGDPALAAQLTAQARDIADRLPETLALEEAFAALSP